METFIIRQTEIHFTTGWFDLVDNGSNHYLVILELYFNQNTFVVTIRDSIIEQL